MESPNEIFLKKNGKWRILKSDKPEVGIYDYREDNMETLSPIVKNDEIVLFHAGYSHKLYVNSTKQLFSWDTSEQIDLPNWDRTTDKIKKISSGYDHWMVLTEAGLLFGSGYSCHGELGTGQGQTYSKTVETKFFKKKGIKIVDICCGIFHTLYLTEDGRAFGSGRAAECALGQTVKSNRLVPVHLANLGRVYQIFAHYRSRLSFFLTDKGLIRYGVYDQEFNNESVEGLMSLPDGVVLSPNSIEGLWIGRSEYVLILKESKRHFPHLGAIRGRNVFVDLHLIFE
jgi:alpha-tubulin suppressor-like RCC1 family protein